MVKHNTAKHITDETLAFRMLNEPNKFVAQKHNQYEKTDCGAFRKATLWRTATMIGFQAEATRDVGTTLANG